MIRLLDWITQHKSTASDPLNTNFMRTQLHALVVFSVFVSLNAAAAQDTDLPKATAPGPAGLRRPNVIVFFTDDHGFSDLRCQGIQNDLATPNIDKLAADGVRMTSGYVTAPQCVPSRAGLLSGKSQNRFGVESNGQPLDGFNAENTIAERLQKAGYATGMTGKWHLGPAPEITKHGFDDVYYKNANRPGWSNFLLDGSDCEPGPESSKLYHLDANSEAACAFVRRHRDEPLFFYCAYRAPHVPLDAPQKYLSRFPGKMPERRRQALAMISAMDDGVGKVVDTLRELNLTEKTMIWLIGDNGAPLKIHKLDEPGGGPGWDGSLNEPLNGEKGMLSEGGIRVPFVVSWKGSIPGGRQYHHPVSSLDVAATSVALAGLPVDDKLDGVNLVPFLKDDSLGAPHERLYWRWIAQSAVREGEWKYLRGGEREYLFNLQADREEKVNLVKQHPDVAERLSKQLRAWSNELQPPGLETKSMSVTWEKYYDFYLDGRPAPPQRKSNPNPNRKNSSQKGSVVAGWLSRNAKLTTTKEGLRVESRGNKAMAKPFIVTSGIKLASPVLAVVTMRSPGGGEASFQWRESGQADFNDQQVASFGLAESNDWQQNRVQLVGKNDLIHVRFRVPPGGCTVKSIQFLDSDGHELKKWSFQR